MLIELNIGLDVEGSVNAPHMRDTRAQYAIAFLSGGAWTQNILGRRRSHSATEDTLIVQIQTSSGTENRVRETIEALAHMLDQDCIALYNATDRCGELIGPKTAAWGAFNPEFFLRFDPSRKTVVLARSAT